MFLFVFILWFVFFRIFINKYFFGAVRYEMKLQTENICWNSSKEDQNLIKKICHVKTL